MKRREPIYVESLIRAPMDPLWNATQDPALHARWDVRFGRIEYLRRSGGEPQRFTYSTTLSPGVTISGTGESLGDRDRADGSRWSGLRFWANDPRSIIHSGAGYWRYIPGDDGIRFLTRFDYRPRWGRIGDVIDRFVFRPVFGWATAWSFDRLRIWLEDGVPPERLRNQSIAHVASVAGLAGVWLYQGLVPKVWKADPEEIRLLGRLGIAGRRARLIVRALGAGETLLGIGTLRSHAARWPFVATLVAMPVAAAGAARADASVLTRAFNPASLNWAAAALAVVALATRDGIPSGRTPLRVAPDRQPEVDAGP